MPVSVVFHGQRYFTEGVLSTSRGDDAGRLVSAVINHKTAVDDHISWHTSPPRFALPTDGAAVGFAVEQVDPANAAGKLGHYYCINNAAVARVKLHVRNQQRGTSSTAFPLGLRIVYMQIGAQFSLDGASIS